MANVLTRRIINVNRILVKLSSYSTLHNAHPCTQFIVTKLELEQPHVAYYKTKRCTNHLLEPSLNIHKFQVKYYSTDKPAKNEEKPEKLTLFQKFKKMYRDYWYVLVPVHLVTSTMWFGSFYYLAKSGVDIVSVLESWNISEKITNPLRDSSMGYIALAYGCYKIATPVRYAVTLGGTTISINYLKKWGYIKPVPSTDRLKEIYLERKDNLIESVKETKVMYKEKKDDFMESVRVTKKKVAEKKEDLMDSVKLPKKK